MSWMPKSRCWRGVLLVSALCVGLIIALLVYSSVAGSRELGRELELLRASGAVEYPEQIVLPPRPAGEDPTEWWKRLDGARKDVEIKDVAACAARLAAGETEYDIDEDCRALLNDPRRLRALTECERALMELRSEADSAATKLALQVSRFAPFDWKSAWDRRDDTLESILVLPRISGYVGSIDLLSADTVLCGLRNELGLARGRLAAGLSAVRMLEDSRILIAFQAWCLGLNKWINTGLVPLLELSEAEADFDEFETALAAIDVQARFRLALEGERALGNDIYRWLRSHRESAEENSVKPWLHGPVQTGIAALPEGIWLDHDQAAYLRYFRKALEARAAESLDAWHGFQEQADRSFDDRLDSVRLIVCLTICPRLVGSAEGAEQTRAKVNLARAAIIARRDGHGAARAFLDTCRDPFSDQPLRSRLESDGILVMWSVGKNGVDDPLGPPVDDEDKASRDDIRVLVRAR